MDFSVVWNRTSGGTLTMYYRNEGASTCLVRQQKENTIPYNEESSDLHSTTPVDSSIITTIIVLGIIWILFIVVLVLYLGGFVGKSPNIFPEHTPAQSRADLVMRVHITFGTLCLVFGGVIVGSFGADRYIKEVAQYDDLTAVSVFWGCCCSLQKKGVCEVLSFEKELVVCDIGKGRKGYCSKKTWVGLPHFCLLINFPQTVYLEGQEIRTITTKNTVYEEHEVGTSDDCYYSETETIWADSARWYICKGPQLTFFLKDSFRRDYDDCGLVSGCPFLCPFGNHCGVYLLCFPMFWFES